MAQCVRPPCFQLVQHGSLIPTSNAIPLSVQRSQRRSSRQFSATVRFYRQSHDGRESFGTRLRRALGETKIKWYPIPVGLGIGFLGLAQLYRVNEREKARRREEEENDAYLRIVGEDGIDSEGRPRKRKRVRPSGPWLVLKVLTDCLILTARQAGPGYVNTSFKSSVEAMGTV